jgi:predicted dehydrogenase
VSDGYGRGARGVSEAAAAPALDVRPRAPARPPPIALVGCGGISETHLAAYARAGWDVVALANPTRVKAEARRAQFYPGAATYTDHRALLAAHPEARVIDVTPHADVRPAIVADCLRAGRHVLSQKPLALDLAAARALVALADEHGVRLAVNQNGRWAPHLAWMRAAVQAGLVGDVSAVDVTIHWDHSWVLGTAFDAAAHLLLFDFGMHWFDFVQTLFPGRRASAVTAASARAAGQATRQPLLAHAAVQYAGARATITLNGDARYLTRDTTLVAGTLGSLRADGPDLEHQELTLHTSAGRAPVPLSGRWFEDGFHGAMAELLLALEEGREPSHSARDNLATLELAFAAAASERSGVPERPGAVAGLQARG